MKKIFTFVFSFMMIICPGYLFAEKEDSKYRPRGPEYWARQRQMEHETAKEWVVGTGMIIGTAAIGSGAFLAGMDLLIQGSSYPATSLLGAGIAAVGYGACKKAFKMTAK